MSVPKHGVYKDEIDHVEKKTGEYPDDDPDHDLDGHDRPGLVLTVTPGTEPVLLLPGQPQHRHHHLATVAVQGGHAGVDVDPSVGIVDVDNIRPEDGFGIGTFAATPGVDMV